MKSKQDKINETNEINKTIENDEEDIQTEIYNIWGMLAILNFLYKHIWTEFDCRGLLLLRVF